MAKTFFLSHSSQDKPTVRKVAAKLGKNRCWIDEGEIRPGDSLFDRIDSGLADSRIFVLFWSQHSANSGWVKEELSQARIRALRDRGFRLIVVKLDSTPLPDALQHRLYLDATKGIDTVVAGLEETEYQLTPSVALDAAGAADTFQNRERELTSIEDFAHDPDNAGILVLGLNGMGKTAVVRRAATRIFPDLQPIWIDLDLLSSPVRLLARIAGPLSLSLDANHAGSDPIAVWQEAILPELLEAKKSYLVIDNVESARSSRRGQLIDALVSRIVEDLIDCPKSENPGVVVIANKTPQFSEAVRARMRNVHVRALEEQYITRALRIHLQRTTPDIKYSLKDLSALAAPLKGYPLAIGLAAALVAERGFEQVLLDLQQVQTLLGRLARELIAGIQLSDDERSALIYISTYQRPLNPAHIQRLLGPISVCLDSLAAKQLFDVTPSGLSLHAILQDYFREQLASPEERKDAHSRVADIFSEEWRRSSDLSANSAEYGSLTCFHALAAGDDKHYLTLAFREEAKEAAIELYRRRDYDTALAYLTEIRKMPGGIEPLIDFYFGLTLTRVGRAKEAIPVLGALADEFASVSRYHHGLGMAYRKLRDTENALKAFRRAVAAAPKTDTVALVSLAEVLLEVGRIADANSYALEAYKRHPGDSSVISLLAEVYRRKGEHLKALDLISDALRRRVSDARLHARAGLIAKEMGDYVRAEQHLLVASRDRETSHAITALADVYLNLGRYPKAEEVLESALGQHRDASYWSTKANVLRHQGRLEEGLVAIDKAIELEPDNPVHHGGKAQLHLDVARRAARDREIENAHLQTELARQSVWRGLGLAPNNEALVSIARSVASLEVPN